MKVLLSYLALLPMTSALEASEKFCTEGFVMDFFCINRGTLLDNPSVVSLEEPEKHSLHCLLDVDSCINSRSPYEVLIDPIDGGRYKRGWRLTDSSKEKMIALGRSVGMPGKCSTCKGEGTLKQGFRAVFLATVRDLNLDDAFMPPLIEINMLQNSNDIDTKDSPCSVTYNETDILDTMNTTEKNALFAADVDNSLRVMHLAHGSMMLIGWGFLLPSGAIMARFFKYRPNGLWFKIHRAVQIIGLLFATTGWIIALTNFSVFGDKGNNNYRHGIMGMVTMIMGLLQPINAFFRPHLPNEGDDKSRARIIWEIYHKSAGWLTLILASATVILGTRVLPKAKDGKAFLFTYIGGVGLLLLGLFFIKKDQRSFLA